MIKSHQDNLRITFLPGHVAGVAVAATWELSIAEAALAMLSLGFAFCLVVFESTRKEHEGERVISCSFLIF